MADPLSVASGIVALITFGLQASSSLLQLVGEFKRAPSTVRQLKDELLALTEVLQSLQATIGDTSSDFTTLETPLYRCTKACQDFEALLLRCAGRSQSAKSSFQDWAKLKYLGSDIDGFKEAIAAYKATIAIALCNANLRTSSVSLVAFNEYKEMITNTTYDLQERLQDIDAKLQILVSSSASGSDNNSAIREQMQEEKESIQKCLEICEEVSVHIATLQRNHTERISLPSGDHGQTAAVSAPAVSAWLAAATNMANCKVELEAGLHRLSDRLKQHGSGPSPATKEDKQELLQEIEGLQRSLDICENASKEAERNRTNIFEEISVTDDGCQVIASTVGELIFARKITAGARSAQVFGQMSDGTIQHIATTRDPFASKQASDPQDTSTDEFQARFGSGRDLHPTLSKRPS